MFEPHSLDIKRSSCKTAVQQGNCNQDILDYSQLPRSSGDGMEHDSEGEALPQKSGRNEVFYKSITTASSSDRENLQSLKNINYFHEKPLDCRVLELRHSKHGSCDLKTKGEQRATEVEKTQVGNKTVLKVSSPNRMIKNKSEQNLFFGKDACNNSKKDHLSSTELFNNPSVNNSLLVKTGELSRSGNEIKSTVNTARNNSVKEKTLEIIPDHIDSQVIITELEERNTKLAEEKVKLSVQLGVQSKVNSELKTLLVASVGEDLEKKLESYVQAMAQHEVEQKHWKTMCEEYQEESERLEIECDVWRTKFMASRMMSDELSSWRSTLYAHYRQSQNALQRLLSERAELQQHLINANKQLEFLCEALKHISGCYDNNLGNKTDSVANQSVLEVASINSCQSQGLVDLTLKMFPSVPLSKSDLRTAIKRTSVQGRKINMVNTPAENMALQVLSRDIELTTKESQGGVMRRMGRQYIGHGHKSRFLTNSFRVTFDCCDRCKGKLEVV